MEALALNPGRLVAAAVIGLVLLLVLIIKFKVQAMVAILIGAIAIGLLAGMPYEQIVTAVNDGIGNTLKGIALLVGLGSMFGAILEVSGGAQTLAVTMVKRFGDQKAAWALGITGLVIAMPVFFDAGLIILIPLINSSVSTFATLTRRQLMKETIETHRAVTNAILKGDSVGARCAMIMHLTYNRQKLLELLEAQEKDWEGRKEGE